MTLFAKARGALDIVFGTALAWLLIGLVNVLFWALFIVFLPFSMIWHALQRRAPGIFGNPGGIDPEDVAAFDAVWDDLCEGNIAALEDHAKSNESFPEGVDPFVGRAWLTNAVHSNTPSSVRWILEQGVDPDFEDDEGYSPVMSAIEMCDHPPGTDNSETVIEILSILFEFGADPNFAVNLDRTALHTAAYHGSPRVVQMLLERGADPFAYDSDYGPSRPVDDARRAKRHDVVKVLERWMAQYPKSDV